jgi:hypothetical protein
MTKQIYVSKENLEYVREVAIAHRVTQRVVLEEITELACKMHRHAYGLREKAAAAMEAVTA